MSSDGEKSCVKHYGETDDTSPSPVISTHEKINVGNAPIARRCYMLWAQSEYVGLWEVDRNQPNRTHIVGIDDLCRSL